MRIQSSPHRRIFSQCSLLSIFISAVHLHLVLGHKGKYYGQNCSKESRSRLLPTVTLLPHAVAELPNCLRVLVSDKSDSSNRHVICTRCFCLPLVIVKGNPTIIKTIIFIFLFIKSLKEGLTCLLVCIHQPHKCHSRAQSLSFHRQTWFFYFPNMRLLYKCRIEILYSFWSWDNYFYREKARGNKTGHTALDKRCTNMSS